MDISLSVLDLLCLAVGNPHVSSRKKKLDFTELHMQTTVISSIERTSARLTCLLLLIRLSVPLSCL
jgi:hypothetical protein